jgi:hypothetical protein
VTLIRQRPLASPYDYGEEPDTRESPAEFFAHVAEANRTRDGSGVEHVARVVLVGTETVTTAGTPTTRPTLDGTPYVRERVWPRAVLTGVSQCDTTLPVVDGSVYDLAVAVTVAALCDYYDEHGWHGVVDRQ